MIGQRGLFIEPGDVILMSARSSMFPTYCTAESIQPGANQLGPTDDDKALEWTFRSAKDAVHGALNLTEPEP